MGSFLVVALLPPVSDVTCCNIMRPYVLSHIVFIHFLLMPYVRMTGFIMDMKSEICEVESALLYIT